MAEKSRSLTEFVGTAIGDTLGLVIANVDTALLDAMKLEKRYRSIGILGARTGAGPHIMAADEAVKATNTEVVSIELPRDTKGGAGHGSLIILGGILGGISTGEPIIARFAIKPTSSILTERRSIDADMNEVDVRTKGRHDPCVGIRAVPVGEAMLACAIADHYLRDRGQTGRLK